MEKLEFLKTVFIDKLKSLDPATKPLWGKMNVQQMIEHMCEAFRQSNGKSVIALVTPEEHLPAYRKFILSEKEFRENTKNVLMGEEPPPVKKVSVAIAIEDLQKEIIDFINHFEKLPEGSTVLNPIFGPLNFTEWIHLFHKHAIHHLKQFGIATD